MIPQIAHLPALERDYLYADINTGRAADDNRWQPDWCLPLLTTAGRRPEGAWFDAEMADKPVDFIQSRFVHTVGPLSGQPFMLAPEQVWLIREAFGWYVRNEHDVAVRLYQQVYVEMGRGNGKSQLGAAIAGFLLFADNEAKPEIIGAAKDREQAKIVLDRLKDMVAAGNIGLRRNAKPLVKELRNVGKGKSGGGKYRAASADVGGSWGGHPHGIIFDEVHTQPHRALWDAQVTAMGKRLQPMLWGFTTAGWERESLCYELHDQVRQIGEGVMQDDRFLGVVWAAAEDEDWTDPRVWAAANPLIGTAVSYQFLADQCQKAQNSPSFQTTFRTMYLSQWVGAESPFLDMRKWDACDGTPTAGGEGYGGLDLSSTTDLTALAIVSLSSDGFVDIDLQCFSPWEGVEDREHRDRVPYRQWASEGWLTLTPGATVDQDIVKAAVLARADVYNPLADCQYDRWNAGKLVQELKAEGVRMEQIGQGFASLSNPSKEFQQWVLQRKVRHGGNPLLRWMLDCTTIVSDDAENIKPSKRRSTGRIDGVVAIIMAIDGLTRRGMRAQSRYND